LKDITKPRFQQQPTWDENVSRRKVKLKGQKKSDPGTEHQMPHSGTKDHVGQGYETNRSRVANNNLGDADVTQAELGVTADPGMKLQDRTEPTNSESNMEEVGEDVYLQTESTDFESDEEGIACATKGLNHDWEEFATGGWVHEGQLLYEK
jgi:hypothetical protein